MRHDINIIAKNFLLDKKKFKEFALKNKTKYGIVVEDEFITTSTSFSSDLIKDFLVSIKLK